MPRPTTRGLALLGLAGGTYLAGRVVGTWELYLFAFAFAAAVFVSWLLVVATGRRIRVTRVLAPDRPVAGDEPELRTLVRNSSWLLPGPQLTLRTPLGGLGSDDPELEIESLAPLEQKMMKIPVGKVNRGVHHVPAARVAAEDPLGLATTVRRVSDPLRVTVHPRIVLLDSCALYPQIGLRHDWSGQQSSPSPGRFRIQRRQAPSTRGAAESRRLEEHGEDGGPDAPRDRGAGRRRGHRAAGRHRRACGRRASGQQLRDGRARSGQRRGFRLARRT